MEGTLPRSPGHDGGVPVYRKGVACREGASHQTVKVTEQTVGAILRLTDSDHKIDKPLRLENQPKGNEHSDVGGFGVAARPFEHRLIADFGEQKNLGLWLQGEFKTKGGAKFLAVGSCPTVGKPCSRLLLSI